MTNKRIDPLIQILELFDRNHKPAEYNYHAGLCAIGGKTTSTMERIKDSIGYLITSPSLDLVKETANRVEDIQIITSDDFKKVAQVIEGRLLKDVSPSNDINPESNISAHNDTVLNAIAKLTKPETLSNTPWHLIADEGFYNVIHGFGLVVHPMMHRTFFKLFKFIEFPDQKLAYKVVADNYDAVLKLSKGTLKDTTLSSDKQLKKLCKAVLNNSKHVLISKETVKHAKERIQNNQHYNIEILSVIRADLLNIFKSVTFLLAHFPKSELAIALKIQGIKLNTYNVLGEAEGIYQHSERLTIKYFVPDGTNWGYGLAEHTVARTSNMDKVIANFPLLVKDLDMPFIWNTWTDYRDRITDGLSALHDGHEHKLNKALAGVNDLRDYTAAAFLKARNMGDGRNVLTHFGVQPGEMDFAGSVLDAYQFIMRTNLRDLESKEPVTVIVPDRRTVNFLLTMFPNATPEYLDWGIVPKSQSTGNPAGRPVEYKHPDGSSVSRNARQTFTRTGLGIKDFPVWLSNSKYKAEHKK